MKRTGMIAILVILGISAYIGFYWESLGPVRDLAHAILDPTFGRLIAWNTLGGFLISVAFISLILSLAQKYLTDQKTLKEHKARIDKIRKELKEHKPGTDKYNELNMEMVRIQFKDMMPLTMGSIVYTSLPIILFFRWFQELLSPIYGGWWILYYLIGAMIFSSIFRKLFKIA